MKSDVLFIESIGKPEKYDVNKHASEKHIEKFQKLVDETDWSFIEQDDLVGIKLHWGELNNITFIDSGYARVIANKLKSLGAKPFVFDTNVLYRGGRQNAVDNLMTAASHGYSIEELGCPVIVADGLRGFDICEIPATDGSTVRVANIINQADKFVILSHFKGHIVAGYGAALKNLSMGFASRGQKQYMHADVTPELSEQDLCIACGICEAYCPVDAISVSDYAEFDLDKCIGCAECIGHCPESAIRFQFNSAGEKFHSKTMKTAAAVANFIDERAVYFNIITNITPVCDCMGMDKIPFMTDDIGFVSSTDPLAADKAADDLHKKYIAMRNDEENLHEHHPKTNYEISFEIAEKFSAGKKEYKLKAL